jgi:hypothetical protein
MTDRDAFTSFEDVTWLLFVNVFLFRLLNGLDMRIPAMLGSLRFPVLQFLEFFSSISAMCAYAVGFTCFHVRAYMNTQPIMLGSHFELVHHSN